MCCADFGFVVSSGAFVEGMAIYFIGGGLALWLIGRGLKFILDFLLNKGTQP